MKKTPLALTALAALFLTACTVFGKTSEVDYNNQVVETINEISSSIESTATLYNDTVPDVVNETDVIDVATMKTSYTEASDALEQLGSLLTLESRNIEQQNAVRTDLTTYQTAAEQYLATYDEMLTYYGEGEYAKDLTKVKTTDETLHTSYTTFIQANNDLVDTLESFVTPAQE
jgi:carbonic anhydrase